MPTAIATATATVMVMVMVMVMVILSAQRLTSQTHHNAAGANLPQPRSAEISGSGGRAADRQSRACLSDSQVCAAALSLSTADGFPKGLRQLSARRAVVGPASDNTRVVTLAAINKEANCERCTRATALIDKIFSASRQFDTPNGHTDKFVKQPAGESPTSADAPCTPHHSFPCTARQSNRRSTARRQRCRA